MKKIILISGKAENGKTTLANILKEKLEFYGNKVVITRYALYLKEIAKKYCAWDGNKDKDGRELLQKLGTDVIRQKLNKPLFHVGRICEDIEITQDYYDYVIIDDVRYENEVYYPIAMFGKDKVYTVRVTRYNELNGEMVCFTNSLTDEQKKHISETSLDTFSFDYHCTNLTDDFGIIDFDANNIISELDGEA